MLNTLLWIMQIILAVIFIMAGLMKLTTPMVELKNQAWAANIPAMGIRILGGLELLGAVALIIPPLLQLKPKLTIYASSCFAFMMISAIILHLSVGEGNQTGINFILLALATLVSWGRAKKVPIMNKIPIQ